MKTNTNHSNTSLYPSAQKRSKRDRLRYQRHAKCRQPCGILKRITTHTGTKRERETIKTKRTSKIKRKKQHHQQQQRQQQQQQHYDPQQSIALDTQNHFIRNIPKILGTFNILHYILRLEENHIQIDASNDEIKHIPHFVGRYAIDKETRSMRIPKFTPLWKEETRWGPPSFIFEYFVEIIKFIQNHHREQSEPQYERKKLYMQFREDPQSTMQCPVHKNTYIQEQKHQQHSVRHEPIDLESFYSGWIHLGSSMDEDADDSFQYDNIQQQQCCTCDHRIVFYNIPDDKTLFTLHSNASKSVLEIHFPNISFDPKQNLLFVDPIRPKHSNIDEEQKEGEGRGGGGKGGVKFFLPPGYCEVRVPLNWFRLLRQYTSTLTQFFNVQYNTTTLVLPSRSKTNNENNIIPREKCIFADMMRICKQKDTHNDCSLVLNDIIFLRRDSFQSETSLKTLILFNRLQPVQRDTIKRVEYIWDEQYLLYLFIQNINMNLEHTRPYTNIGPVIQRKQETKECGDVIRGGNNTIDYEYLCCICLSEPHTVMILDCGHKCLCESCAFQHTRNAIIGSKFYTSAPPSSSSSQQQQQRARTRPNTISRIDTNRIVSPDLFTGRDNSMLSEFLRNIRAIDTIPKCPLCRSYIHKGTQRVY